ncbi:MFS transporter [Amycolatopsis sp. 195334CR]|nr:MFS transporter [Amycolatopsis sp. 195334CR]
MVTAAYAVLSLVVALPLGRLADRTGRTAPVLVLGTALLVLGPVALALSPALPWVAAAAACLGFGHIVFMVGAQGYIASAAPESDLDRYFGLFTAAVSAGQMFGPLLAGMVLGTGSGAALGQTAVAALVASAVAAGAIPAGLLLLRHRKTRRTTEPRDAPGIPAMLRSRGMVPGLFISLALLGAVDLLTAYLPLIAEDRDISPAVVGVLLALRSAASILSRLGLGRMARRWPRHTLILTSAAGSAVALAVVALPVSNLPIMAAALVAGGFLLGMGQPLTMTVVVQAVPRHGRNAALALRLWANRLGQVTVPAAAGLVAGPLGAAGALWLATAVLLAAAATAGRNP